jgi:adenylate cyclase
MKGDTYSVVHAENRRLAAIMFTDIVGFSRRMGSNEARMLRLLETHNRIIQQAVAEHHGTVIKTVGDAFLVDFPSVVNAVQCAQQIQSQLRPHNAEKDKTEQIHVRIGIHLGDVVQRDGDVFGDGVNIASRLQTFTAPDTICISDVVYRDVAKKLDLGTVVSLGRPKLKNITGRFQVYALLPESPQGFGQKLQVQRLRLSRRVRPVHRMMAVGVLLVAATLVAVRALPFLFPTTQTLTPSTQEVLPLPDKPSIAVLPFTNLSDDSQQAYFGDGMAEDLITDLSQLPGLFVTAHHSAPLYKGKAIKIQGVSKELGVRYVLEGSVRKTGDHMLITAQLIDGTTGGHVWADRYDRPLRDLFTVQEEVRRKILVHLGLKLKPEEEDRLQRVYTSNFEAYNSVAHARESYLRITPADNVQARQLCEKAIALDPSYAVAYALMGFSYAQMWGSFWTEDPQALERAFELAQQALALDGSSPVAHELLGVVYLWRDKQIDQAIAEEKWAVAHSPSWFSAYI